MPPWCTEPLKALVVGAFVIAHFPGETTCLSLCWAVLYLVASSLEWRPLYRPRSGNKVATGATR